MSERTKMLRRMDDDELRDYIRIVRNHRDSLRTRLEAAQIAVNEAILECDARVIERNRP